MLRYATVDITFPKIPSILTEKTNKTRPINEIMEPAISKSFLDSIGVKSGIFFCITMMKMTIINSHANPYLQLRNVVMIPPKRSPIAAESATITISIVKANVRLLPEYVPLIIETVAGVISAPAIPSITSHPINSIVSLELIAAMVVPIP